ncbi:SRPBCC family protein [Spirillospora albida]|uniref:SRPBCC family protein n=1 Tax=Spirillospora albida TaxID=58123 RepID=UPI00068EFCD6|nr:SRPBCC family protein [Spirillospora albida]
MRGKKSGLVPIGNLAKRLPVGRSRKRTPDLSRITKNLPSGVPGGRTAGAAGGVLLGVGTAVAAGRALSRRGKDSSPEETEQSKAVEREPAEEKAGEQDDKQSKGLLAGVKDSVGNALKPGGKGGKGGEKVKVTNIVEHIDIGAPRRLVYNQYTQFQDFPSFMKKVVSVDQEDETKLHWKAKIFWSSRSWESTIIEQVPDQHIVWRSKGPKGHVDGTVSFHKLAPNLTRVLMVLEYHPQGLFEKTANMWRAQGRRARLELKHFRRYVMTRSLTHPDEVEGWRGEIHDSEVVRTHEEALDDEKRAEKEQQAEYEEVR